MSNGLAIHHHLLRDSLPPDSLYLVLNNLEASGHPSFDYQLVETYEAMGQTDLAAQKLSLMQSDVSYSEKEIEELLRYIEMKTQLNEWTAANGQIIELDETQKGWLYEKAIIHDRAGAIAMGILMQDNQDVFEKPILIPQSVEKARRVKGTMEPKVETRLDIYPNPAQNFVNVRFSIHENLSEAVIRFVDVKGIVHESIPILVDMDELILPLSLPNGSYEVQLINGQRNVITKPLLIE